MITDFAMQVSTNQALTTTAVSTDSIDLSSAATAGHGAAVGANPHAIGTGKAVRMMVDVTVTLEDGTSIIFEIVAADDAALTTNIETLGQSDAYLEAVLLAGRTQIIVNMNPDVQNAQARNRRFMGARYTIAGTFTAGTVTTSFLLDIQNARVFPASTSS